MEGFVFLMIQACLCFSLVFAQSITLFKSTQDDCETECIEGLISGSDTVKFKSQVTFSGDPTKTHVVFYVKKKYASSFTHLRAYTIDNDCKDNESLTCSDVRQNVINITMRQKAWTDFSGASIYAKLITSSNLESESEIQHFPIINDLSNTSGQLVINEKKIRDTEECFETISGNDLNINYTCQSQVLPCKIYIEFDDGKKCAEEKGNGNEWHECKRQIQSNAVTRFKVHYGACNYEGNKITRTCTISGKGTVTDFSHWVIVFISLTMLITCAAIVFSVFVFFRMRSILTQQMNPIKQEQMRQVKEKLTLNKSQDVEIKIQVLKREISSV